jgi:PAS domain S-box-containing protein
MMSVMASPQYQPDPKHLLEAELRATLNLVPAYSWYANPSGALTFVNERLSKYLGLPDDHPLRFGTDTGASWDSHILLLHPDDHEETRRVWSACLRTGSPGETSFRVRNGEGGYRWFVSRAEPVRAGDGTLLCWIGVNLEIEEQKRAEQELRNVLNTIPAIVWAALPDGSNTYVNSRYVEYSGMAGQEIAGSGWRVATHPDDLQRHEGKWRASVASGEPLESEVRFRRADGQYRWHLDRGLPVRSEDGHITKWYGVVTDIEDRKRIEEALRRNEHFLAEAQRLSHTGSFGWRPDNGEIVWSDETYRIFEHDSAVKPTIDLLMQRVHPDDRTIVKEVIDRAFHTGTDFEHEYRLLLADGRVKHVHAIAHAIRNTSGNCEFVGAVSDITERKAGEERIREQETELREILDLAPQLIAVYGRNRERLYANRNALEYAGVTQEEWRQTQGRSAFVHPDDRPKEDVYFDNHLYRETGYELELRLRRGDGTYRWFLARSRPVLDDKRQVVRWYVSCADIEDRKQAEERLQQENDALRDEVDKAFMFEEIVGSSSALTTVLSLISKVAPSDSTVLITGETGTGKELVARAIHRRSNRSSRSFVSVNCAAIPRDLIASELFGHEKGAFTGATQQRLGRFELANGGTIFLDEVGELPAETQVALLRVLQEHEFQRVGSNRQIQTDVRVIAATNRDLEAAIVAGSFRSDLFYRLNVFPIEIPSLRERREDIPLLVEYFVDHYARKAGKRIKRINKKTLELLQLYPWPGNIRELQNVVERSVILCESDIFSIDERWLPHRASPTEPKDEIELPRKLLAQEKLMIEAALKETRGRVFGPRGAAAKLGIPRSTLEWKIRSFKIDKNRFKINTET